MDWLFTFADPTIDWNYAMVTLIVRFIGVFVVMAVIQVALQLASRIVGSAERRGEAAAVPLVSSEPVIPSPAAGPAGPVGETAAGLDDATVAAIAAALALESGTGAVPAVPGESSAWSVAGHIRQLHRPLPRR